MASLVEEEVHVLPLDSLGDNRHDVVLLGQFVIGVLIATDLLFGQVYSINHRHKDYLVTSNILE